MTSVLLPVTAVHPVRVATPVFRTEHAARHADTGIRPTMNSMQRHTMVKGSVHCSQYSRLVVVQGTILVPSIRALVPISSLLVFLVF